MTAREMEALSKREVFLQRMSRGAQEQLFSKAAVRRDAAITALIDTCMAVSGVLKEASQGRFTLNPVNEGAHEGWVGVRVDLHDSKGGLPASLFTVKVSWSGREVDVDSPYDSWSRRNGLTLNREEPSEDVVYFRQFFQDAVMYEHTSPLAQHIAKRLSEVP